MKETVDIEILIGSRNGDRKIMQYVKILSRSPSAHENKEVEPVEPVQMNICQNNTYTKDLCWLHFDDEPWVPER